MRALSIRQPFAELILRGINRVEFRTRPTRMIGQRFWIYACKGKAPSGTATVDPKEWMIELAEMLKVFPRDSLQSLPKGVIVGSAVIERISPPDPCDDRGLYRWHLSGVERAKSIRKPRGHPQPVWFRPF